MTPRPSTDDLRDELRRQARTAEAWDVPAVLRPERRTSPWPTGAVVLVAAAVVAALLVVPTWWTGGDDSGRPSDGPSAVLGGPPVFSVAEWTAGAQCELASVTCAAPETVQVGERTLVRTSLRVVDLVGRQGEGVARGTEQLDLPGRTGWIMVGLSEDEGSARLGVEVVGGGVSVKSDGPTLFSVGGGPRRDVPVGVTARDVSSPGAQLFVATFDVVGAGPRSDWVDTSRDCPGSPTECAAPTVVTLDGADLVRAEDGADGAGELQGGFQQRQPGAWFMLGTSEPDDGGPLEVGVGGADPVTVPVDRPVLVRLPDGAPPTYEVRTEDGRPLPLFMRVYRLAES